ncbi:MAG: hypothetical protein GX984_06390 [Erysipelothrix sp.]|mgnify:CR=1 FL=1|nr:hypothetical protein [Erysipelothrix sp.]
MEKMSPIFYVTENFIEWYRSEYDNIFSYYKNLEFEKIDEIFDEYNAYKDTGLTFRYKDLLIAEEEDLPTNKILIENVKRVHSSLNMLTPIQASDERLWFAMYHKYYKKHMTSYINKNKNHKNFYSRLKGSILFEHSAKRSLVVQNISLLWWLGHNLYDEANQVDPYYYLSLFAAGSDLSGKAVLLFSNNITHNKQLLFGILEAENHLVNQEGFRRSRNLTAECLRFINFTGSVRILDIMTKDDIKNLIVKEFTENSHNYKQILF